VTAGVVKRRSEMSALLDDISRIIASPIPRRQALRLLSGVVGGGVLTYLGRASRGLGVPAGGAQAPEFIKCPSGEFRCGGTCCKNGLTCCNGKCCTSGQRCIDGTCCPSAQVCGAFWEFFGRSFCCPSGQTCCNGRCCPSGQTCCNRRCCPSGQCCNHGLRCCPTGYVCCGGTECKKATPSGSSPCVA